MVRITDPKCKDIFEKLFQGGGRSFGPLDVDRTFGLVQVPDICIFQYGSNNIFIPIGDLHGHKEDCHEEEI